MVVRYDLTKVTGVALSQDQRITVLCVDDHPIVREGIVSIIEGDPGLKIVAEAATAHP